FGSSAPMPRVYGARNRKNLNIPRLSGDGCFTSRLGRFFAKPTLTAKNNSGATCENSVIRVGWATVQPVQIKRLFPGYHEWPFKFLSSHMMSRRKPVRAIETGSDLKLPCGS